MARLLLCAEGDLAIGEARRLDHSTPISVFRSDSGYYAVADLCTHGQASLAEGYVEGDTVECPLHMAQFCLRTGKALTPPANRPVEVFPVVIEAGQIFVEAPG
jgi:3-phenylpropionate/trans-cinnamate dioxygenase ferredoxin subunit